MIYIVGSVEDLVPTEAEQFDAVVSSEVIEHVADLKQFIDSCCKLVKVCQVWYLRIRSALAVNC